ncbi:MAG: HAD-IIIA family hydrolase [Candidatus Marinimicrobia bacterium]|nr:HAD-IIIA family hydrolase [Candidatus Neomarinimicrobiota bacterium]
MKITTVFLDRDGVLNVDKPEYLLSLTDVQIHDDVPAAVKKLTDAGMRIIVVSNQAGIGKGLLDEMDAEMIFQTIIIGVEADGGKIDAYYYCPHTKDDECTCRKPEIGMFMQAVKDHGVLLEESVLVGDGFCDAKAAETLNIPFYLVRRGWGPATKRKCDTAGTPYVSVKDLREAVEKILALKDTTQ